jgi:hypothetical protein
MTTVTGIEYVWDNGSVSLEDWTVEDVVAWKERSGARNVVSTRWRFEGKIYSTSKYVRLIKDRSGFIAFEHDDPRTRRLIVINGDSSERLTIGVPRVDANSRPEEGYLALPPSSARFGGIEWGCEGNDGFTDYLFEFDLNTGALLRYARPTRPW